MPAATSCTGDEFKLCGSLKSSSKFYIGSWHRKWQNLKWGGEKSHVGKLTWNSLRCIIMILRPLAVVTQVGKSLRIDHCGHNVWSLRANTSSGLPVLRLGVRIVVGKKPWKHDDRSLEVEGEWGIPVWSNTESLKWFFMLKGNHDVEIRYDEDGQVFLADLYASASCILWENSSFDHSLMQKAVPNIVGSRFVTVTLVSVLIRDADRLFSKQKFLDVIKVRFLSIFTSDFVARIRVVATKSDLYVLDYAIFSWCRYV